MRLLSFRIQNFRSIIDTEWCNVSTDNITALIGQNESGKTTLLEGLKSFYDGMISENVLRSDLSMPVVYCSFEMNRKRALQILEGTNYPQELIDTIDETGRVTMVRSWIDDQTSKLEIADEKIIKLYKEKEEISRKEAERIKQQINNIIQSTSRAVEDLARMNLEKDELEKRLKIEQEKFRNLESELKNPKTPTTRDKEELFEKVKIDVEKTKIELTKKRESCEKQSLLIDELVEKSKYAKMSNDAQGRVEQAKKELDMAYSELLIAQENYDQAISTKQKKSAQSRLDLTNRIYFDANKKFEHASEESAYRLRVTAKVLDGYDVETAEREAGDEMKNTQNLFSLEDLGNIFHQHVPPFEFFEDFSSLLPDRIDLEDIFQERYDVEGYKAARNFLNIAGLTTEFFRQRNNRILKQKIEALNGEINVNFHEYWQQSIGKKNKIKINFDLEHYDFNHPEKKGKPYLEFWIKDENERLYPKQRSRGVRWFISFYLELKATAIRNSNENIILLIDEPGVSLHARAQEDVLKVFEDIKDHVQIVYTTHSPHLIDINKLYRLRAVQRTIEDDDYSETVVFDAESLNSASTDTLSPIYTLMGTRISGQQIVQNRNNVIIEDIPTYYYLTTFFKLMNIKTEVYFLPATDVSNIPTLVNILLGWKLDFVVLVDDDSEGNKIYSELRKNIFWKDEDKALKKLLMIEHCKSIEDVFSTIDFKKHVIKKRVGITESNSEYIEENNLSRPILASQFMSAVDAKQITFNDFDDESQRNIKNLVEKITNALD